MTQKIGDSKRVAKNTLILYFRTIITTIIALYTSRVVLQVLGVDDFGVFSVISALVTSFSFVNSNLQVASQRFISFELGKTDVGDVKKIYSVILTLYAIVSAVLLVVLVGVGYFYVYHVLVVNDLSRDAAFYAFLFCCLNFIINMVTTPYFSAIIAYERMTIFAYLGMLEAILKLAVCYMLWISDIEKIVIYSALLVFANIIVKSIAIIYCLVKLPSTKTLFSMDVPIIKELGSFLGWNVTGSVAVMLREQGVSMLYNYFFGPVVNAARSIASSVKGAAYSFVGNFSMALNPQITKLCAAGDYPTMNSMVHRGSKYSFYLMLILTIPLCLNIEHILQIWLVEVPDMSDTFVILAMIFFNLKALQTTVSTAIIATGNVKRYNIYWGVLNLLIFPISLILFKLGCNPSAAYYVCIAITVLVLFAMLSLYKKYFGYSIRSYAKGVLLPCALTTSISLSLSLFVGFIHDQNVWTLILKLAIMFAITAIVIFYVGMTKLERSSVVSLVLQKLNYDRKK